MRNMHLLTRQNAEPVVLMSLEDYHSIEETLYRVRSQRDFLPPWTKPETDTDG